MIYTPDNSPINQLLHETLASSIALPKHPLGKRAFLESTNDMIKQGAFSRLDTFGLTKQATSVIRARPKFTDPYSSPTFVGVPLDVNIPDTRKLLHRWMRFFYATHHMVSAAIDIYARYPLKGMEVHCKDDSIQSYYRDYYSDMDYDTFLVNLGLEYWKVGEAFPMGEWSSTLGRYTNEELLNPDDVEVYHYPMLKKTLFELDPPAYLKEIIKNRKPEPEYMYIERNMPEMIQYVIQNKRIPVPQDLIGHLKFGSEPWISRGYPILMRGLQLLMTEEKLTRAMQAVADRLYTPLILMKLGGKDVGPDNTPWVPDGSDYSAYQERLETALESDYRIMTGHFAMDISAVNLGEKFPRIQEDFDRIDQGLLSIFGIDKQLMSGGSHSTYASTAMSAEFMIQRMADYQKAIKVFIKDRFKPIAEAQEFYDYEKKGATYVPLFEEYVEYDSDQGVEILKKRRKLLLPDLQVQTVDLRDEKTRRGILDQFRKVGVPVSNRRYIAGNVTNFDQNEEWMVIEQEQIDQRVAQLDQHLAVQAALISYFMDRGYDQDTASQLAQNAMSAPLGADKNSPLGGPLAATPDSLDDPLTPGLGEIGNEPPIGEGPASNNLPGLSDVYGHPDNIPDNLRGLEGPNSPPPSRPPVSDSLRPSMPKRTSSVKVTRDGVWTVPAKVNRGVTGGGSN